jgi:hypothetical protein
MAWFDRDERATAMGIKQTGVPGGGVVVALVAAPLVLVGGWRGALAALGIINFFFGFIFSALWREPEERDVTSRAGHLSVTEDRAPLDVWSFLPVSFGTAIFLVGQMALITSVGHYSGRRYVWQDWLGCSQRPLLCRTKKNCSASYRHDRFRAVGGIESHGPAITALSAFARGIFFRCLFGRISRRILRLDRRAGWKSQSRSGFGAHDHDQRRRGDSGHAAVRLYRRQESVLFPRMAGACRRRRGGLRWARPISQRSPTDSDTYCAETTTVLIETENTTVPKVAARCALTHHLISLHFDFGDVHQRPGVLLNGFVGFTLTIFVYGGLILPGAE